MLAVLLAWPGPTRKIIAGLITSYTATYVLP